MTWSVGVCPLLVPGAGLVGGFVPSSSLVLTWLVGTYFQLVPCANLVGGCPNVSKCLVLIDG